MGGAIGAITGAAIGGNRHGGSDALFGAAAGALAGVAGALVLTRYLATLLYGVTPTDFGTYIAVVLALALAALGASFLPARRAAALDPASTLRHE